MRAPQIRLLKTISSTISRANIIYVKGAQPVSGKNIIYRDDGQPIYSNDTYNPVNDLWDINPLFVDSQNGDYHLQAGSPAIDAGYNLNQSVPNDFAGTVRPAGPRL